MKSLPGWKIKREETSNGIIRVTLTDASGRMAEVHDPDTNETMISAKSHAFDIEKQISKNWNKFLFDLFLEEVENNKIKKRDYNDQAFGSWSFEFDNKRLLLDGKDFMMISQSKYGDQWNDDTTLNIRDLTYRKYLDIIATVTQK
jgi:hypothetical protein